MKLSKIALKVFFAADSRALLDVPGAEQLLGSGDMLFLPFRDNECYRIQGPYIDHDEVELLNKYVKVQAGISDLHIEGSLDNTMRIPFEQDLISAGITIPEEKE